MSDLFSTPLFEDPDIAHLFSPEHSYAMMLSVEVALARAQARLGLIPEAAAQHISEAAASLHIDESAIQTGMDRSGVPTIALIHQLREAVGGDDADHVHRGATTQDVMDTALILQLREIFDLLDGKLLRLMKRLALLAHSHRHTLMAGRTHSQQALPLSFGLKVAGWLAPLIRHRERLRDMRQYVLVLQLGGAVGTMAAFGDQALHLQEILAKDLGLGTALMAWHTQRDNIVEVGDWLSRVSGSLGKMAQDIILLAQSEIGEVRESDDANRGGSSTMPQKSNPVVSEGIITAARLNASLISALHQAQIQEHERATGAWQIEWQTLPWMCHLTASALNKANFVADEMQVNTEQMRKNVTRSQGMMLAEALSFALTPYTGRVESRQIVRDASQIALRENRHLVDVIRDQVDISLDWDTLRDEANYLGQSDALIDRVLAALEIQQAA